MTAPRKPRAPRRKPATPQTPPFVLRVFAEPKFRGADTGEGGIRQVMEHVAPYLEAQGVIFVDDLEHADVIHYHASPYAQTRRYLEAHPEQPAVSSTHGLYWQDYSWDKASLSANADVIEGMRLADVVTAPTEWVAQAVRRGISADVRVVNHGVDMAEFTPPEVHEGYLLWDKTRVDSVCDPTPVLELARRMPGERFVLCAGPETALPNVKVLGRMPYQKARELSRHAALYLCVTRETFGLATLQAMAAGVPVVGWNYGGQAEIVGDGGILVEPGNLDALVVAVRDVSNRRTEYGEAASRRAASYTWAAAADGYMAAYRAAIAAYASPIRVSIIVAAYNAEKTIGRTIDSALAAMGPDDELIVVDDASTDDTFGVIGAHLETRVRVIQRPENGYLAQARNTGLAVARGRYVTCLDADDELTHEGLNLLAGELDKDRSTTIAYGKIFFTDDYIGPDGSIQSKPSDFRDQRGDPFGPGRSPWPFAFDWRVQNRGDNVTCIPYCAMVRTPGLKRAGGWRTRCRTGEDLDLWMRLVSFGARPRMVTEADVLRYHTSSRSMSATNPLPAWAKFYPWTEAAGQASLPPWGLPIAPDEAQAWPVAHHSEPMVSVVIPVGPGHERYIFDALDSVMAQTYRRWECIVINDTGASIEGLPGWARLVDARAMNVNGIAHARNAGLARARAPFVVFLDADDWLDRQALDYMSAALEAHPEIAVAYSDYWDRTSVAAGGRTTWEYTPHKLNDWDCQRAEALPALTPTGWDWPASIYSTTAIYRRDALNAVGGFDTSAPGHEDGDLHMALAYAGYCAAHIPRRLFVYNLETGSRRSESKSDEARVLKWVSEKYGGRQRMACSSCGGGPRVVTPIAAQGANAIVLTGAMTEVAYIGAKLGTFSVRGAKTGLTYNFGGGQSKPVMNEDLEFFHAMRNDYRVIVGAQSQPDETPPELTIDGPPSGKRSAVA